MTIIENLNSLSSNTCSPVAIVSKILSFSKLKLVVQRARLSKAISAKSEYIYSSMLLATRKKYTANRLVHNTLKVVPHDCFSLNVLLLVSCWFDVKPIVAILFWIVQKIFTFIWFDIVGHNFLVFYLSKYNFIKFLSTIPRSKQINCWLKFFVLQVF